MTGSTGPTLDTLDLVMVNFQWSEINHDRSDVEYYYAARSRSDATLGRDRSADPSRLPSVALP